jgi:hypothetical protein
LKGNYNVEPLALFGLTFFILWFAPEAMIGPSRWLFLDWFFYPLVCTRGNERVEPLALFGLTFFILWFAPEAMRGSSRWLFLD